MRRATDNRGPGRAGRVNAYLESGGDFDLLDGGPGNDHLAAFGDDGYGVAMIGGAGRDVFDVSASGFEVKILDFRNGEDKILLGNNHFAQGQFDLYNLAIRAGVQWNMDWIAFEGDNGVTFPLGITYNSYTVGEFRKKELDTALKV